MTYVEPILQNTINILGSDTVFIAYTRVLYAVDGLIYLVPDINTASITLKGPLHQSGGVTFEEEISLTDGEFLFTNPTEIEVTPNRVWISADKTICLNHQDYFIFAAGIYHYKGKIITAEFASMFSSNPQPCIPNITPILLSAGFNLPIYGKYSAPINNQTTPYAVIVVDSTEALTPIGITKDNIPSLVQMDTVSIYIHNATLNDAIMFALSLQTKDIRYGVNEISTINDDPVLQEEAGIRNIRKKISCKLNYAIATSMQISNRLFTKVGGSITFDNVVNLSFSSK